MPVPLTPSSPAAHHLLPGLRVRHDGWTRERVSRFLELLAHHGCVRDAARIAGLSNQSAYKMKRRFPRFSEAWDHARDSAGRGLEAVAYNRAVNGKETIIIRKGEEVERRITPSDSLLALLIKRGDLAGGEGARGGTGGMTKAAAKNMISFDEYHREHIRFDGTGRKYQDQDPRVAQLDFNDRIARIKASLKAMAERREECPCCQQTLPAGWPKQSMAELTALGVVPMELVFGDGEGPQGAAV